MRRLFGFAVLAAVALGAAVVFRRRAGGRDRVDLYYEDGSMTTLEDGTPEALGLLSHARDALAASRAHA